MNLHQRTSRRTISLFGSEYGRFFQFIGYFQKYDLYQLCSNECVYNHTIRQQNSEQIFLKKIKNQIQLYYYYTGKCTECQHEISSDVIFLKKPPFLFISFHLSTL